MAIKCPKCNADNPDTSKFCADCGTRIVSIGDASVTKTIQIPTKGFKKDTVIAKKYKIIEKIGEGGMGIVYKAEDTRLDRTVALKFLPPELLREKEAKKRFIQEAKAAAALDHPNICTVYEVDEADGQTFIAMSYIEGQSLKDKLKEGPLNVDEAKDIALQVAEGLKEAHEKGIVHRDIKPANIMLTEKGQAKITDFGLAKLSWGVDLTKPATIMGTVAYMSPEQARGEEVDHRTDIWSLGAMLYEMLSGERPFQKAQEQALIYSILNDNPTPLSMLRSDIPTQIEHVIEKALAKKMKERYQHIAELIGDLKESPLITFAKAEKSIVVLPFDDLSPDRDQEYFSDGLTEEVISDLSGISALRVISRSSAMTFKGTKKTAPEIAKQLNVQYVLEGSVRKAGNNLRITAQLIDATKDTHLWAEKYNGIIDDVFDIQEKVSRSIFSALKLKLSAEEEHRISKKPIENIQAYEYYLKAREVMFGGGGWNEEQLMDARELLESGLKIIGDNARLYSSLAHVYFQFVRIWVKEETELAKSEEYAQKALSLDPDSAQAYMVLGMINLFRGNPQECFRLLKKGLILDPNDLDTIMWGFWISIITGRKSYAVELANRMIDLEPMSWRGLIHLGCAHAYDGNFELAIDIFEKHMPAAHKELPYARFWLSYWLLYEDRSDKALEVLKPIEKETGLDLYVQTCHFLRYVLKGEKRHATDLAEHQFQREMKRDCVVSLMIAEGYVVLGETEQAFNWLENAVNRGFINYPYLSKHDPILVKIRDKTRFKKLMERVKHEWENFEV